MKHPQMGVNHATPPYLGELWCTYLGHPCSWCSCCILKSWWLVHLFSKMYNVPWCIRFNIKSERSSCFIMTSSYIKHPNHVTTCYVQQYVPFHVQWHKAYAELNLTWNWHAVWPSLFIIADILVNIECRSQKPLLIYALYLNVNDYF